MTDRTPRPAGPAPDEAALREAALAHLARFGATEAGLVRVLDRRVDRWARRAEAEGIDPASAVADARGAARRVARALATSGAVDDAAFAAARARRLARAGRSRQAVAAHLASKGVASELARTVLPDEEGELLAAVLHARRRRLGPFRPEGGEEHRTRELAALARAGFGGGVARAALRMDRETAEAMVEQARREGG